MIVTNSYFTITDKEKQRIYYMKQISTTIVYLLLQSSSPRVTKVRLYLQNKLIAHF